MKVGEAGEAFFVFETEHEVPKEFQTSPIMEAVSEKSDEVRVCVGERLYTCICNEYFLRSHLILILVNLKIPLKVTKSSICHTLCVLTCEKKKKLKAVMRIILKKTKKMIRIKHYCLLNYSRPR